MDDFRDDVARRINEILTAAIEDMPRTPVAVVTAEDVRTAIERIRTERAKLPTLIVPTGMPVPFDLSAAFNVVVSSVVPEDTVFVVPLPAKPEPDVPFCLGLEPWADVIKPSDVVTLRGLVP